MELVLDVSRLCTELHNISEDDGVRDFCDTPGEQYLYENVVKKCVTGEELRYCDIDFDAFDEDDIVNIIDEKDDAIDADLCAALNFVKAFEGSEALTSKTKRFF